MNVTAARLRAPSVLAAALVFLLALSPRVLADATPPGSRAFGIARLKYGGGGDWYEDRTSLVNLMRALKERTAIPVAGDREAVVEPGSPSLFQYPFVFACGHGNMKFTPAEVENVRRYLLGGGFLWVDDDFGIDPSFRREMKRVFPDAPIVELPFAHPIFHSLYDFPGGLPKIHEHDGGPARAFGIVVGGRSAAGSGCPPRSAVPRRGRGRCAVSGAAGATRSPAPGRRPRGRSPA